MKDIENINISNICGGMCFCNTNDINECFCN